MNDLPSIRIDIQEALNTIYEHGFIAEGDALRRHILDLQASVKLRMKERDQWMEKCRQLEQMTNQERAA